jgi:hypothetical protein
MSKNFGGVMITENGVGGKRKLQERIRVFVGFVEFNHTVIKNGWCLEEGLV